MKLELYLLQNMPRCNCVSYQNLVVCSNSSTGIFNPLQSLLKRVDKFCALTPISPKHSTEKRLQPNIWRTNRFATSTSSFQKRFTHWRWSITDRCNATLTFASHGKRQCVMATVLSHQRSARWPRRAISRAEKQQSIYQLDPKTATAKNCVASLFLSWFYNCCLMSL